MALVTPNSSADANVQVFCALALDKWGDELLDEAMKRVHKDSGLLEASLTKEPVQVAGKRVTVVVHDGPGVDGRTYGIAEEVIRGGSHAFMRPAFDAVLERLPQLVHEEFGSAAPQGPLPAPAFPTATGTWTPGGKRTKRYSF